MTPRQKAFADAYIATGNASEAARRAGYSSRTANRIGHENLTKPVIAAYIAERMAAQDAERVADADEVLGFLTSIMRGEIDDRNGKELYASDRIKAAQELMKRYKDAPTAPVLPIIIDDVSDTNGQ